MALVILLLTPAVLMRTPVDIFPDINIPVVSIIWNFNGLSAQEMADRITTNSERGITTTVNDIEHIESQSLERLATQLLGQRMVTSVILVKALGRGWDAGEIQNQVVRPTAGQIVQP